VPSLLGFAQLHPKKLVENQFVLQALRHLIKGIIKNSTIQRVAVILIVSSSKEPPLAGALNV
jgi:hypothetical protein